MSKRIIAILRDKGGVSLVFVLCFMLLLMTIGTSVLVSASNTASAARAREDSVVRERYAKELAEYFSKEVVVTSFPVDDNDPLTPPEAVDDTNPFVKIVQEIYENSSGNTSSSQGTRELSEEITAPVIIDGMETKIDIKLSSERVNVVVPYQAAITTTDPEIAEVLEETEVFANMQIAFTATYKEKNYTVYADYAFEGVIKGIERNSGNNVTDLDHNFTKGEWTILGYSN